MYKKTLKQIAVKPLAYGIMIAFILGDSRYLQESTMARARMMITSFDLATMFLEE